MAAGNLYQDPQATTKRKPQPATDLAGVGGVEPAATTNDLAPTQPLATSRPPDPPGVPPRQPQGPQPAETIPPAAAAPAPDMTPQEAQAAGLGWVDRNHPLYGTPGFVGSQPAPTSPPPPPPVAPPVPPRQPQGPQPAETVPPIEGYTGPGVGTPETPIAPIKGGGTDPTTPPPPNPNADRDAAYKSALLKMLDQASTPASLEDPALKGQADAYSLAQTRARERARSALAERAAGEGGAGTSSGAFSNDLAGLFQQQGEAEAGFNAGLIGDANKSKVQQLQTALTMMGSDINSEQGRALTKELAQAQLAEGAREFEMNYGLEGKKLAETIRQFDTSTQAGKDALAQQLEMFKQSQAQQGRQFDVDAALKKLGIQSQSELGQADLRLRDKLGSGGLNAQILQMLMNNDQFGKRLGADVGMFNASQGTNYLQALLSQLGA